MPVRRLHREEGLIGGQLGWQPLGALEVRVHEDEALDVHAAAPPALSRPARTAV